MSATDDRFAWRLAIRLARRETIRRPWRTVLVALMVLIPTAAMTVSVIAIRTGVRSPEERVQSRYGQADLYASGRAELGPSTVDALQEALPADSRVVVERQISDRVRQGDERTYFDVSDLPLDDPIGDGRIAAMDGRAPRATHEVAVPRQIADELDVGLGDTLRLDRLKRTVEVVGVIRPTELDQRVVFVGGSLEGVSARGEAPTVALLVDVPGGAANALGVTAEGWSPQSVYVYESPTSDGAEGLYWTYVIGGVALVVFGTVITAAFAVSARTQLHALGLLAASGASPRTIRRNLIVQGAVIGALGAVAGVALAVAVAHLAPADRLDELFGHEISVIVAPLDIVPIVILGLVGAAAAASIPAWSAARISTLQALAGRRPLTRVPRRMPVAGGASLAVGAALFALSVAGAADGGSSLWSLVAIAGALATLAGVCLIAPWIVGGFEPAGDRWSESWRLAGRSLARHRLRSSAVVGAVCVVASILVAGTTLDASSSDSCCDDELPYLRDDQVIIESYEIARGEGAAPILAEASREELDRGVEEILPSARRVALPALVPESPPGAPGAAQATWVEADASPVNAAVRPSSSITTATPDSLAHFGIPPDLSPGPGEALTVVEPPGGVTAVDIETSVGDEPFEPVERLDLTVAPSSRAAAALPVVLIGASTAESLGLVVESETSQVLYQAKAPLDERQRDRLQLLADDVQWEFAGDAGYPAGVVMSPPASGIDERLARLAVLGVVLTVMVAVVAVGLALAARDNEDERRILAAVGAPPSTMRRVDACRAALLVGTGGLLALPAGLPPAVSIYAASVRTAGQDLRLDVAALLFVVAVVPLVAGTVVWVARWALDLLRPARPDVYRFAD